MKAKMFSGATGRVFILICVMYFIEYIDRVNLSVAAPLIKKSFVLSNTELGMALAAFGYCYAIFQVVGGYLGDRFGPRKMLAISGLLWASGTIATGLVGGLGGLIAARLLVGTGEAGTIPVATRAMTNWVPRERRGFAQGFTHSASRSAAALTPPLVVMMIPWVGWRGSFIVLGCVSLLWTIVWFSYFRDDPHLHRGLSEAEKAALPVYADSARHAGGERRAVPWWRLLKRIMPVTLVFFAHAWALWMYLTWLPSFFVGQFHVDLTHSALFTSAVFLAAVVGNTAGGMLTDWLYARTGNLNTSRRNVVLLGFGGSILFMIVMLLLAHQQVIVTLCLATALFFLELSAGPVFAIPIDIAPAFAGVATGFISTAAGLAAVVSPVVFGYIVDRTGSYTLPFVASIGILSLGIVMSFWMRADRPLQEDASADRGVFGFQEKRT